MERCGMHVETTSDAMVPDASSPPSRRQDLSLNRIAAGVVRFLSSPWVLGAFVAALAAPLWVPRPGTNIDPSWQAAMHMAARQGLDFGREIDFTYGPLGFLAVPSLYYTSTTVLAVAFTFGVRLVTCTVFLRSARKMVPLWLALPATYIAVRALRFADLSQAIQVLVLVHCLSRLGHADRDHPSWFAPAAGVFSAVMLLVKFNAGLFVLALYGLTICCGRAATRRATLVFLGSFLGSVALGWLVTGNHVGDLVAWTSASLQIASGYSTAMGIEAGRGRDFYYLVPAILIIGAVSWSHVARWDMRDRFVSAALLAVFLYAGLKHGFVRHDEHALSFFGVLPGLALGLTLARRRGVAAFLVLSGFFVAVNPFSVKEIFDPRSSLRDTVSATRTLASGERRLAELAAGRQAQRAVYGLEPETLAALDGGRVHVNPWEASVMWAYPELVWKPIPIFQTYTSYTSALDARNAAALADPHGPDRILQEPSHSVDFRNPDFESPLAIRAMLCNFAQVSATAKWQVLTRVRPRCGEARPLGTVRVAAGQTVDVPPPATAGAMVFVRLRGIHRSAGAAVLSLLYKVPEVYMDTDDGSHFRIVPKTASGPLLMSAPAELGYAPQFGFGRQVRTFRLGQTGTFGSHLLGRVTAEFFEVPLR
jgi:hypothetical protein